MVKQIRLMQELPLLTVQHEAPCRHYSTSLAWEKSQLHSEPTFSWELQNLESAPFLGFLWHSPFPSTFSVTPQNTDSGSKIWGIITAQSCTNAKSKLGTIHLHVYSPQFYTSTALSLPMGLWDMGLLDANHGVGLEVLPLFCVLKWMMGIKILPSDIKHLFQDQ